VAYLVLIFCTIVFDQVTKAWVVDSLRLYESVVIVPGFFNLVYVTNSGAAFSLLANVDSPWRHYFFLGVGSLAMVGLSIAYWKLRKVNKYYTVALALIVGGAAGNLIDRIRFGAVIDFLDVYIGGYHWPAFNVADSAICIGAGLFLILNLFEVRTEEAKVKE
jgi:signal peptidase II